LLLGRHAGRIYFSQSAEKPSFPGERIVIGLNGVISQLIVVPVVAEGRGKLRLVLELIFPVIGEDGIERLHAVVKGKVLRGASTGRKREEGEKNSDGYW
jgi:hypothetical protein